MKRIISVLLVSTLIMGLLGVSFAEPIPRETVTLLTEVELIKVLDPTGPYVEDDEFEFYGWPITVKWQNTPWHEEPTLTREVTMLSGHPFPETVYVGWYTVTEEMVEGYSHDDTEYRFYVDESGVLWTLVDDARMPHRMIDFTFENERLFRVESFWAIVEEDMEQPVATNGKNALLAMGKKGSWWDTFEYPVRFAPLYADQDYLIGSVSVGAAWINIHLEYPGVMHFVALHAHLAEFASDIPQNKGGNPKVGHFEYQWSLFDDGPWVPIVAVDETAMGWAAVHGEIAIPLTRAFPETYPPR